MTRKLTQEEFTDKAKGAHGEGTYDYSQVIYVNNRIKITIGCSKHGSFQQRPDKHLEGKGCPSCAIEKVTSTTEEFVDKANLAHGEGTYDYSQVVYVHSATKITIGCSKHGPFEQTPTHHLAGKGCPSCAIEKATSTTEEFTDKAELVHGTGVYDYSQAVYVNSATKVTIRCSKHGPFEQTPSHHLNGHGCPKCSNSISKPETRWLDHLGIPEEDRQFKIKIGGKTYKVDGHCKKTNTIYELHGDFWHGNPHIYDPEEKNPVSKKTFGELFEATAKRTRILKGAGYNVVSIWESDWLKQEKEMKN